jgi:arabinan endo-1,5-alpha-L-arabinosidase
LVPVSYTNPVYGEYFADPFVWRHEGEYYAIGTGAPEAAGSLEGAGPTRIFPLLKSSDLISWRPLGRALVRPAAELGDSYWAPEVVRAGRTWFLYYSVGFGDTRHQLRVATSDEPSGPYRDSGVALTDLSDCPFAIDPHPFRDDDGRWYLFHARDFLTTRDESGREVRPGTALVVHALETMTRLCSRGTTVLRASHDWQRFLAQRTMYGRIFDWHTLEGPFVQKRAGRYYCFFSGGRWESADYGVDFAVASDIRGPWSDAGGENGPRVLRSVPGRVPGPGHNSIITGPDGVTEFIVYHAWDPEFRSRRLCIDELAWTTQGPVCRGPTWTEQRLCPAASRHAR